MPRFPIWYGYAAHTAGMVPIRYGTAKSARKYSLSTHSRLPPKFIFRKVTHPVLIQFCTMILKLVWICQRSIVVIILRVPMEYRPGKICKFSQLKFSQLFISKYFLFLVLKFKVLVGPKSSLEWVDSIRIQTVRTCIRYPDTAGVLFYIYIYITRLICDLTPHHENLSKKSC